MADTVDTNSFKNGMHIELDGKVWRILEFQHVKPGKGGAFVRSRLRNLDSGAVVDKTFRAGEKFPRVHTEVKNVQYLYEDGTEAHFMDPDTYETITLDESLIGDAKDYLVENLSVQVLYAEGKPVQVELPASVSLKIVESPEGVRGDTASNVTKPATLETGKTINVPLFIKEGETIKIDTRTGAYMGRA